MTRLLILLAILLFLIFLSIPVAITAQNEQQKITSRMKKQKTNCKKEYRIKKHDWIWLDEKPEVNIKIIIINGEEDVRNVEY